MTDNKRNSKADVGCILLALAAWLAFKVLVVVHEWTWPVWPWLALSSVGWFLATRGEGEKHLQDRKAREHDKDRTRPASLQTEPEPQTGFIRDATKKTLSYITFGLAALTFTLILINIFHGSLSADFARSVELSLIHIKLTIKERSESLPLFLGLVVGALVVSHFAPRLRALERLNWLKTAATAVYVALIAITSFTLFAQAPLQNLVDAAADRNRKQIASGTTEYHAQLRKEHDAVAKYLAARTVENKILQLDQQQLDRLRHQLSALDLAGADFSLTLTEVFHCSTLDISNDPRLKEILQTLGENVQRCQALFNSGHQQDRVSADESMRNSARENVARQLARSSWSMGKSDALLTMSKLSRSISTTPIIDAEMPPADPPEDVQDWDKRNHILEEQKQNIRDEQAQMERVEATASSQILATKLALSRLLRTTGLGMEGIVGAYVDEALDSLIDLIFDKATEVYHEKSRPSEDLAKLASKIDISSIKTTDPGTGSEEADSIDQAQQMVASEIRTRLEQKTLENPPRFVLTKQEIYRLDHPFDHSGIEDPYKPDTPGGDPPIDIEPVHPVEAVHPVIVP